MVYGLNFVAHIVLQKVGQTRPPSSIAPFLASDAFILRNVSEPEAACLVGAQKTT